MSSVRRWFDRLPTTGKLMVILSAAVLPLGLVLIWAATSGINQANSVLVARANDQGRAAARAVESLVGRNALALRIAGSGALRQAGDNPCDYVAQSLAVSSAVSDSFLLQDARGLPICGVPPTFRNERANLLVAPGDIRLWLSDGGRFLYYRVGLNGGHATGVLSQEELREAALASQAVVADLVLSDGAREMPLIADGAQSGLRLEQVTREHRLGNAQLTARSTITIPRIAYVDRLIILLPVLMWIAAALLSWLLVSRFLLRPLRRVQTAVSLYEPGQGPLELPDRLGSATEIRELGHAFARAVDRIEQSEHEMSDALEGQRKLVREVHHRVKNNLQVVASLLNIHGRTATSQDARDAYSSIGRRVDALAVVHRNHYAELEENRGIALRPLLSELAASLRASAPDSARGVNIDLDLESLQTTQDVAVAVAFLVTEIVEFAMLSRPNDPVELTLRRSGELTAGFQIASAVLNPEAIDDPQRRQFERIIAGLAKQLRSNLERKLGRYGVELPVFPARP
ncbi:sensor histidine kinase [Sphingomonas sp. GCM10030256]|uniref:sensor histidine kinase n=1 Tax=Sphingomonas sp. GCM10030256 TaxID=3273427 RepID=UPI00362262EB